MRIALFTETYLPQINGVVTHIKVLKEGLESLGHEVLVVTADPRTHHHYIAEGVLHCPARPIKRFYNNGLANPVSPVRLKMLRNFDPDIIHIHTEFGVGLSGLYIAKILRKPLVYTLHTMYDDYIYYIAPKPFVNLTKKFSHKYTRFLAEKADALTGPSQKCQEYFDNTGLRKKVNVIPNAVELDNFSPDKVTEEEKIMLRQSLGLHPDQTVACFVGRLGREKSVDVLLDYWAETIKKEDNLLLMVIGGGPCLEELQEQAERLNLGDRVIFTGAVEHDKLLPYLAISEVYITASLSDTNSISMLEGMAMGLPVLQRYDELNADQVREGENGFVFRNAAEMIEKLKKIQNQTPEEMEILRKSVINSVKQSGAENLANYVLTVYYTIYKPNQENESQASPTEN